MDQPSILDRAKAGDAEAFAALLDPHLARMDATARLVLRDGRVVEHSGVEVLAGGVERGA